MKTCDEQSFIDWGVLVPAHTPRGSFYLEVDWCNPFFIRWWMCNPHPGYPQWPESVWKALGLEIQEYYCSCQPDCAGKECGDDGCDGTCGTCSELQECDAGSCEVDCDVMCEDRDCGIWGGCKCGSCASDEVCVDLGKGVSWCYMDCDQVCPELSCAKIEGALWSCNCPCPEGYICSGADKVCKPYCDKLCKNKECGVAGLYGECNCGPDCGEGYQCVDGACAVDCGPACENVDCGLVENPNSASKWCFCGECAPGNLCWDHECKQSQCSPECELIPCDPEGCEAECGDCGPGELCGTSGSCCPPMSAEKEQAYEDLLANIHIQVALSPLLPDEKADLLQFVWELECNATQEWDEYGDNGEYPPGGLSYETVRKIWLRRNAVILYNEANQIYPWSIVPELVDGSYVFYTPDMLNHLMRWDEGPNEPDGPVWNEPKAGRFSNILYQPLGDSYTFTGNRNPATAMQIAHTILAKYAPSSPVEALYASIDEMWAMDWKHSITNENSTKYFGLKNVDLQTHWALRRSGCSAIARAIQEVMRAMGIPAARASLGGHSGVWIEFVSGVKVLPSGDHLFGIGRFVATPDIFYSPKQLADWGNSDEAIYWWSVKKVGFQCYVSYRISVDYYLKWFALYEYEGDDPRQVKARGELKIHFCNYLQKCLVPGVFGCNSLIYNAVTKPFKASYTGNCFDGEWYEANADKAEELEVYLTDDDDFAYWLTKLEGYYSGVGDGPFDLCTQP